MLKLKKTSFIRCLLVKFERLYVRAKNLNVWKYTRYAMVRKTIVFVLIFSE